MRTVPCNKLKDIFARHDSVNHYFTIIYSTITEFIVLNLLLRSSPFVLIKLQSDNKFKIEAGKHFD